MAAGKATTEHYPGQGVITAYAQTNLQLLNQLGELGYDHTDLARTHEAYELAMRLFTGQFRSNGKPFLNHLVGTASILAAFGCPPPVVIAGLLHASYASGEWGDGGPRVNDERRAQVRQAVGDDAEELVLRYTLLGWNESSIPELAARAGSLEGDEASVVAMRLANLLEDYLDLGMAYCQKGAKEKQRGPTRAAAVELAAGMGFEELAAELKRVFAEDAERSVPAALVRDARSAFTIAPLSHCRRPDLALREAAGPARKAVRRALSGLAKPGSR